MKNKIEGKLVTLIKLKENHLPLMVKWRNDPFVSRFMIDQSTFTIKKQIEWFKKIKNDKSRRQFIITECKSGMAIGAVNLMSIDNQNKHCDWGFYIGEEKFRMGGYAIETEFLILRYAFEVLNMNKIYCETFTNNNKVITLHKSFGFVVDGILREHYRIGERYEDVIIMSILKSQFAETESLIQKILNMFER